MSRGEYVVVDKFTHNGYKVEIIIDQDCGSPRDDDGNFLFISFPSRDAIKADEELDPETHSFPCPACDGSGYADNANDDDGALCGKCEGDGICYAQTLAELVELVKVEYKAHLVLPVARSEHGPNCEYHITSYTDTDEIRSWVYGLILDTPETLEERGCPDPLTDDWLREGMEAEIDEYSKWANGECYGYGITDRNGEHVDSCWGFIGNIYAEQEARDAVRLLDPQPPMLYDVRLTKDEIDGIRDGATPFTVYDKLAEIDTSEED